MEVADILDHDGRYTLSFNNLDYAAESKIIINESEIIKKRNCLFN